MEQSQALLCFPRSDQRTTRPPRVSLRIRNGDLLKIGDKCDDTVSSKKSNSSLGASASSAVLMSTSHVAVVPGCQNDLYEDIPQYPPFLSDEHRAVVQVGRADQYVPIATLAR